ncbi:MAG: flagellar hook-length control protein FliK [Planctomycetota bacterium]
MTRAIDPAPAPSPDRAASQRASRTAASERDAFGTLLRSFEQGARRPERPDNTREVDRTDRIDDDRDPRDDDRAEAAEDKPADADRTEDAKESSDTDAQAGQSATAQAEAGAFDADLANPQQAVAASPQDPAGEAAQAETGPRDNPLQATADQQATQDAADETDDPDESAEDVFALTALQDLAAQGQAVRAEVAGNAESQDQAAKQAALAQEGVVQRARASAEQREQRAQAQAAAQSDAGPSLQASTTAKEQAEQASLPGFLQAKESGGAFVSPSLASDRPAGAVAAAPTTASAPTASAAAPTAVVAVDAGGAAGQSNSNGAGASGQGGANLAAQLPDAGRAQDNAATNTARISRGLSAALQQKGGSVTIRLTPAELGTVRIQLQVSGQQVSAQFHAEQASARGMIQNQLHQLRAALESQGLTVDRFGVQPLNGASAGQGAQAQTQGDDPGQRQSDGQRFANDGRSRGFAGGQRDRHDDAGRNPREPEPGFDQDLERSRGDFATAGRN